MKRMSYLLFTSGAFSEGLNPLHCYVERSSTGSTSPVDFLIERSAIIVKTNSDFSNLDGCPLGRGALIRNFHRLFLGPAIDEEETSDDFLGFREGTIDDGTFATSIFDPHPFGIGTERVARPEHATRLQIFGKAEHARIGEAPFFR